MDQQTKKKCGNNLINIGCIYQHYKKKQNRYRVYGMFIMCFILLFRQLFRASRYQVRQYNTKNFVLSYLDGKPFSSLWTSVKTLQLKHVKLFYEDMTESELIRYSTKEIQFLHAEHVLDDYQYHLPLRIMQEYLEGYASPNDRVAIVKSDVIFFYDSPFTSMDKIHVSQAVGTTQDKKFSEKLRSCLKMDIGKANYRLYSSNAIIGPWRLVQQLLHCVRRLNHNNLESCEDVALTVCINVEKQLVEWASSVINPVYLHCNGKYPVVQNLCYILKQTEKPCVAGINKTVTLTPCAQRI